MRTKHGKWQPAFLEAFASTANMSASCRAARVDRSTVYKAMKRSMAFASRVEEARLSAVEGLELIAWRRAAAGSDRVLMFLLRANSPRKYSQKGIDAAAEEREHAPTPSSLSEDASDEELTARYVELVGGVRG